MFVTLSYLWLLWVHFTKRVCTLIMYWNGHKFARWQPILDSVHFRNTAHNGCTYFIAQLLIVTIHQIDMCYNESRLQYMYGHTTNAFWLRWCHKANTLPIIKSTRLHTPTTLGVCCSLQCAIIKDQRRISIARFRLWGVVMNNQRKIWHQG